MKAAGVPVTALCVAPLLAACGKDPVGANMDAQLTIAAESVAVNMYRTASLSPLVSHNTVNTPQYISRNVTIATVNAVGTVTGVGVGSTYVAASIPGYPKAGDSIRVRVYSDSCGGARPDFGGPATVQDRAVFSYNVDAPLNLTKTITQTNNGVEVSNISFTSPDGGLVNGMMWDPITRSGSRPGIVLMHGLPGSASSMAGQGQLYAQYGAVVIAIDAPWNRRTTPPYLTITGQDRVEQIQVVKDLQRAVDVLRSRSNVDADRIAYVGFSWGGATGALFAGIERRLTATALVVGHGGQVSHATGPVGSQLISNMACPIRVAWIRAMTPIEPIRFVGNANAPLLLQNGHLDEFVPAYEAEELHAAAPALKTILWYAAGHNLGQQAAFDRHDWLVAKIGLDPR
jgi:dienelactone hydrolase